MKKRLLALLLAATMLLSLIPMTVFATGTTYAITNGTAEGDKETNHGYIVIDKATATKGETVTITVKPNEGYQLKSLTVTPVAPTEYNVTFDLNGITGTAPTSQTIKDGEKVTKPADPTDTIHTFAGWYKTKDATTGALSDPWDFNNDTVTANMTLYAKWTRTLESIYTNSDIPKVTNNSAPENAWVNGDGGKAFIAYSTGNTVLYLYKQLQPSGAKQLSCRKTENFTKIGDDYVLDYYLNSNFYGKYTLHMTDGKFTSVTYNGAGTDYEVLSGTYAPEAATYTVTFDMQGHGTQIDPITDVASGSKISSPTAPIAEDYAFKGWYKTKDATTGELSDPWNFESDTVTENTTLYAKWVEGKTIKSILGTVTNFPKSISPYSPPDDAWRNRNDIIIKCFNVNGILSVNAIGIAPLGDFAIKQSDGTYVYEGQSGTITFVMTDEKLVSINVDKVFVSDYNGDYVPVKTSTVGDVFKTLGDAAPTEDSPWLGGENNEKKCYQVDGSLTFDNTGISPISADEKLVSFDNTYTYDDGPTIKFIMNDNDILESIQVSGIGHVLRKAWNGTYAPAPKLLKSSAPKQLKSSAPKLLKSSAPKLLKSPAPAAPATITPEKQQDGTYQFTMPGYAVTVTAEFEEKAITIADILPDDFPTCVDVLPPNLWVNGNEVNMMVIPYSLVIFTLDGDGNPDYVTLADDIRTATLTESGNNYTYTNNGVTTTFLMSDNGLESVKIEGLTGEYVDFNGTYGEQHAHSFTYTVNGGKLTATCTAGCDKGYDTTPLTLTLTAPASLVYDGNAKAFTFADGEATAWTGAGLELPTITYYQKYSGQGWYTQLNEVPVNAGGDYMAEIVANNKAAQVKFTIDKATPYIKTNPEPTDIVYGKKLSDSTLAGGYVQVSSTNTTQVGGWFEWKLGDTIPALSDSETTEYDVTFTPADTNNYNTVSCKVKIKVTHTHNPVKVTGQAATETDSGWKDYYKCDCGALFEDENGTTPIENLESWKAQGGNIPKLTHNPTLSEGKPATFNEPGYKPYYLCNNCGKYYYSEDATGLIEIPDINAWKAEGGAGYIPSGKEKLTVSDFDEEPVLPGAETYEVKEDGIHIYSGDIVFSGEIDEKVFIEGPDQAATFTNLVIKNSVYANNLSENVTIYMDGATIEGNVSATGNGTDDLYLCINIENDNEIKGDVTSDGSITVYGFPNATLDVKSAKATTMLYLNGLRLENMKEEYNVESTLTATPDDASKPITFAVKKEAVFPDDEEFIINGGKPFAYGEDYNIAPPVVCDENGTPFDTQPELTVVYYEYITDGEWDWEIKALDGKPTKEGTYLITFYMPESDLYYTGSHFYEYKIGHNIQMVEGKVATTEEAGYKAYYECKGCGKFYEDASGLVEITDLAKWKAESGNGYIAKLEKQTDPTDPTSPQTGDNSHMTLWLIMMALSSMGLCACLVLGKKRKNVQ